MPCRLRSFSQVICALGNARRTSARICSAEALNPERLYEVRVRRSFGADASVSSALMPSGIAMNGIVVSGLTKHPYG